MSRTRVINELSVPRDSGLTRDLPLARSHQPRTAYSGEVSESCPRINTVAHARQRERSSRRLHSAAIRALTIALAAIACPTVVHRTIFAARLASRLICRKSNRANHRCENRKQNFSVLFHTRFNVRTLLKLRERFGS